MRLFGRGPIGHSGQLPGRERSAASGATRICRRIGVGDATLK